MLKKVLVLTLAPLLFGAAAVAQPAPNFTLKYGIIAGLTGDPAASGQAWNEASKLAFNQIAEVLAKAGLPDVKIVLADSQDAQGSPQAGVEAANKLVQIDRVNVIVGHHYSAVTSALATAVAIPNKVIVFTGGTSPALTKLNTGSPSYLWQPVPADDLQGRVLAKIIGDAIGDKSKVNIASRNDAYGTNLSAIFKAAWIAGGGTVPKHVTYNPQQPTLDSEAQEVVDGSPDGWLFIDYCPSFAKLALPLARTGKWDAGKSFGSDTLNDCSTKGTANYPGMRATQASASAGASFPAFKALFESKAKSGVAFASFSAEGFDSVYVSFLAALAANSSDPTKIAEQIVKITNAPGEEYTFLELDKAIQAIVAGRKVHFNGATGPINFTPDGRVSAVAYDIWQMQPDGSSKVVKTVPFKP